MLQDGGTVEAGSGQKLRLKTLGHLDMRTRAGKRTTALAKTFAAELGGQLTSAQRLAVERAATLVAIAEDARIRRLAGDTSVSLQDIVRLDNNANRAMRALGLDGKPDIDKRAVPSLAELEARRR